jgi:hypothetical protein
LFLIGKPCAVSQDQTEPRREQHAGDNISRAESHEHGRNCQPPAEPQTLAMIFAIARDELATLSIRSWPRDDLALEVERILDSFEIIGT